MFITSNSEITKEDNVPHVTGVDDTIDTSNPKEPNPQPIILTVTLWNLSLSLKMSISIILTIKIQIVGSLMGS